MTVFKLRGGLDDLAHLHLQWLILPPLLAIIWLLAAAGGFSGGDFAGVVLASLWLVSVCIFNSLRWVRSVAIRDDGSVDIRSGFGTRTLDGAGFVEMKSPGWLMQAIGNVLRHREGRFFLPLNFPGLDELELELRELNRDFRGRGWKGWGNRF